MKRVSAQSRALAQAGASRDPRRRLGLPRNRQAQRLGEVGKTSPTRCTLRTNSRSIHQRLIPTGGGVSFGATPALG